MAYLPGQILKFTYKHHTGAGETERVDDFKEVLVLHPLWKEKMHAIDLKRLTPAERKVIDAIFDKAVRDAAATGAHHRFSLVNDILKRMNPLIEIKNPMSFYAKFVKVFLRNRDAYRTYFPSRMLNVVVVDQTSVKGTVFNPNPLFKKVDVQEKPKPLFRKEQEPSSNKKKKKKGVLKGKVEKPKIVKPKRPR